MFIAGRRRTGLPFLAMASDSDKQATFGGSESAAPRSRLINSGRDTKITFRDGSTIVLKGVMRVEVFLPLLATQRRAQNRRQLAMT
jgi:hypothetical protein